MGLVIEGAVAGSGAGALIGGTMAGGMECAVYGPSEEMIPRSAVAGALHGAVTGAVGGAVVVKVVLQE